VFLSRLVLIRAFKVVENVTIIRMKVATQLLFSAKDEQKETMTK